MVCSYCDKVAFYQVGERGYCSDHKREAIEAEAKSLARRKALRIRHGLDNKAK